MILGMGVPELLLILVVVLLIFGPKNLPKLGKSLGKTVKNVREGMEEGDAMPRAAARTMRRQLRGHIPEDADQAVWITSPESVDYSAADASRDVMASVLSPAALRVMEENAQDGVTWDMITELKRRRQQGREV